MTGRARESESVFYDLHLHTCLSPCGDTDMTPNNIIHMAKLKGLDLIAVTDHNTCGNCAAAIAAGRRAGLSVLPGMELCTSEDIHVVCLFGDLDGALAFSRAVRETLPDIQNRPEIFGEQLLLDEWDAVVGREETLLITASGIGFDAVLPLCRSFGGTAFPAHADKTANGVVPILGALPPEAGFQTAELSPSCDAGVFLRQNPTLCGLSILKNSDAHVLWDISERENALLLPDCGTKTVLSFIDGFFRA